MPYKHGGGTSAISVQIVAQVTRTFANQPLIIGPPKPGEQRPNANTHSELSFGPVSVVIQSTHAYYNPKPTDEQAEGDPFHAKVGFFVTLSGLGEGKSDTLWLKEQDIPYARGSVVTLSATLNTTLMVSIPTDQLREYTTLPFSLIDAPFPSKLRLFEQFSPTQAGSASCAGLLISGIASGSPSYTLTVSILCDAAFTGAATGSCEIPNGYSVTDTSSGSSTTDSGSVVAGFGDLTVTAAASKYAFGALFTQTTQLRSYALSGVVRAMETAYPDALEGYCIKYAGDPQPVFPITGGGFSFSHSQRRAQYSLAAKYDPNPSFGYSGVAASSVDEWQNLSASITSESLTAVGDDPRATRLLFRGSRFAGISLSHAASTLIDDCSALTKTGNWAGQWQASDGGAAPTSGSDGIAFSGSVRRAFTHDVSLSSYRYLTLRIKSATANAPLTCAIGGKSWSGKTGAADQFSDVRFDLCAETNQTATTSTHDSKWPLQQDDALTKDDLPLNEGAYFGVGRCAAITISGVAGAAFVVSRVEMVRDAPPTMSYMPAFYNGRIVPSGSGDGQVVDAPWPVLEYPTRHAFTDGGGTSDYYARRFGQGIVDGTQGLEIKDSGYIFNSPPSGYSSVSPYQISIAQFVASINAVNVNGVRLNPGWTATSLKPAGASGCDVSLPDFDTCYLNDALPAVFLFGGGMLALADGTWRFGLDQTDLGADGQELFDELDWFPGCGNMFGFGPASEGGAIVLRSGTTLRSSAQGLTLKANKKPALGRSVSLLQGIPAPGSIVNQGVSTINGFYKMSSSPSAKTVQPGTVQGVGTSVNVSALYGRKRQRVVLISSPNPCHILLVQDAHYFPFTPQFSDPAALPFDNVIGLTNAQMLGEAMATQTDPSSDEEAAKATRYAGAVRPLRLLSFYVVVLPVTFCCFSCAGDWITGDAFGTIGTVGRKCRSGRKR